MTPIKYIKEVKEPLNEQILNTIDDMRAWLKPLDYSDSRCWSSHQPSAIIHQASLSHHRDLIGNPSSFFKVAE